MKSTRATFEKGFGSSPVGNLAEYDSEPIRKR